MRLELSPGFAYRNPGGKHYYLCVSEDVLKGEKYELC